MTQEVTLFKSKNIDDGVYKFQVMNKPKSETKLGYIKTYLLPEHYRLDKNSLGEPTIFDPNGSVCFVGSTMEGHPRIHSIHGMTDPLIEVQ
jgi:hypothetical protein